MRPSACCTRSCGPSETAHAIMTALREVIADARAADGPLHGPGALGVPYATGQGPGRQDAADAGGPRVGSARASSIFPPYSPQARGRSERLNRTFQDRLVNELRVAKITTLVAANRYLRERFVPNYNADVQLCGGGPGQGVRLDRARSIWIRSSVIKRTASSDATTR